MRHIHEIDSCRKVREREQVDSQTGIHIFSPIVDYLHDFLFGNSPFGSRLMQFGNFESVERVEVPLDKVAFNGNVVQYSQSSETLADRVLQKVLPPLPHFIAFQPNGVDVGKIDVKVSVELHERIIQLGKCQGIA